MSASAKAPSPCPLPPAGEGKAWSANPLLKGEEKTQPADLARITKINVSCRDVPPLLLRGEGKAWLAALPQVGERKAWLTNLPNPAERGATFIPTTVAGVGGCAVPPLPLAGEGRGEGPRSTAPPESTRAPLPYAAAHRHSRSAARESLHARDGACVLHLRFDAAHAGRRPARRSVERAGMRNRPRTAPAAPGAGIDSRRAGGCAGDARACVRHRSSAGAEHVRFRSLNACTRFPSPCPLPQAGEGKAWRANSLRRRVILEPMRSAAHRASSRHAAPPLPLAGEGRGEGRRSAAP